MKKKIIFVCLLLVGIFLFTACETKTGNRIVSGKDVQTFTYGYVRLGDKSIVEGYITQWRDYENGDEVQVLIGGKYYLTHYSNVVLIADPAQGSLSYSDPGLFSDE